MRHYRAPVDWRWVQRCPRQRRESASPQSRRGWCACGPLSGRVRRCAAFGHGVRHEARRTKRARRFWGRAGSAGACQPRRLALSSQRWHHRMANQQFHHAHVQRNVCAGRIYESFRPRTSHPLFDGVTPTSFGFAYGNSQSATLTQYYDNWNIAFAVVVAQGTVSAVPTLSDGTLLLLAGLLTLGAFAALRRRS
jgi:hypothetical protein